MLAETTDTLHCSAAAAATAAALQADDLPQSAAAVAADIGQSTADMAVCPPLPTNRSLTNRFIGGLPTRVCVCRMCVRLRCCCGSSGRGRRRRRLLRRLLPPLPPVQRQDAQRARGQDLSAVLRQVAPRLVQQRQRTCRRVRSRALAQEGRL